MLVTGRQGAVMKIRFLAVVCCGACAVAGAVPVAHAETVAGASSDTTKAAVPAPYPGPSNPTTVKIKGIGTVHLAAAGDVVSSAAAKCKPGTGVDNPHLSANKVDASGHGWWTKGNCHKNSAWVTDRLLEYYTDGYFHQKASARKSLGPSRKGHKKKIVNARKRCSNFKKTGWMNLVDVDVRGEADDATAYYRVHSFGCRVN